MSTCAITPVGTTYTIGSWSASDTTPVVDSAGNEWSITHEEGLTHAPAPRTNAIPREQSDGDFDGDTWQPGRPITLEGVLKSPTEGGLYTAMRGLRALLVAGARRAPLVVAYPDITVQAVVRRDGETLIDKLQNSMPRASFSMILYSADPNLYGETLRSSNTGPFVASGGRAYPRAYNRAYGAAGGSGIATVTNDGNTTTYPLITIAAGSAPLVNPAVTIVGGLALVFALTLAAGDVLTIDTQNRSVVLNGAAARTWPLTTGTLAAPAGVSSFLFTAASASSDASMTVQWRDAYA